ncbi:MAG TPA: class I SAM-dependent methyltransferase, partial [Candidatus Paceibacterota bacterium]|nr:class I SAM-dependent methyltransferase [Candidatus Paceibacterota bacterium]
MEFRKQKEAKFHDEIRDKKLEEDFDKHKYLTSNKKFYSVTRRSQEFINNYLIRYCSGRRSLDYCCGNGELTFFLAKYGSEATGIDISSVSIQNCQKEAVKRGLERNTNFLVMDAENLKF